jgi:hypothetical protein
VKKILYLNILIILYTISCSYEGGVAPEDDGISWEYISGKIAYIKGKFLYYLDPETRSVINLGATNLTNIKWNKTTEEITGIVTVNDPTYSLEAITLDLKHSVINNSMHTEYYDWMPDGRLVTISKEDKITIDGDVLLDQTFNPVFGLACSPDGNKIVISTDNLIENLLLEIDINSLNQRIVERNLNLFDPNFEQPIYSLDNDKVFYMTFTVEWDINGFHDRYKIWSTSQIELEYGKNPSRLKKSHYILITKVYHYNGKTIGIYQINIETGNSVELVRGGHESVWIY